MQSAAAQWCFRQVRSFNHAGSSLAALTGLLAEALRPTSTPPGPKFRSRSFARSQRRLSPPLKGQGSRPAIFNSTLIRFPDPFDSGLPRSALVSRPRGALSTPEIRFPFRFSALQCLFAASTPLWVLQPAGSKHSTVHCPVNPPPLSFVSPAARVLTVLQPLSRTAAKSVSDRFGNRSVNPGTDFIMRLFYFFVNRDIARFPQVFLVLQNQASAGALW